MAIGLDKDTQKKSKDVGFYLADATSKRKAPQKKSQ